MLPKPDKNKIEKSVVDPQIIKKRLQNKHRLVLLSLFLTVGLSFIFWSYRHLQKILISPPKFDLNFKINLPQFHPKISLKNSTSPADLDKYIKSLPENWSVFVTSISDQNNPIYQHNFTSSANLSEIIQKLSSQKPSDQSLIGLTLPEGLLFQESFNSDQNFTYQNIISLPQNKLLFLINIDHPKNIDQAQKELPILINKIYWYSVDQIN